MSGIYRKDDAKLWCILESSKCLLGLQVIIISCHFETYKKAAANTPPIQKTICSKCSLMHDSNSILQANETLKSILPQIGDDLKNGTYLKNYFEKNITQHKIMSDTKNASFSLSLCDGHAEEISIYDRKTDIDMKFVQDSITVIWKLIFLLIFVLVLLVFIIAFIISLWRKARRVAVAEKNKRRRYSLNRSSEQREFFTIPECSRSKFGIQKRSCIL